MRAAVFREPGSPLVIEEVQLDAPGPGEIRVRIEAAGVCHSDYHYMTGDIACPLPIVLGHEGAGIVEALGEGAGEKVKVGDRVALLWRPRCGKCEACVTGNPVLCQFGRVLAQTGGLLDGTSRLHEGDEKVHHFLGVSCFAEYSVVSESSVVVVPDGVPPEVAAIAGCAVITGVGAAFNAVHDAAGRPLVVFGAGGVGLSAVMGAQLIGANPIVVVDMDDARLDLAKQIGATHVVNAADGRTVEKVLDILPTGAPWVIEAIGRPDTMQQAFATVGPAGTLVAIGLGRGDASFAVPVNELVQRQKKVVGSLYGSSNPLVDLPRIFELYLAGKLPLDALLGDRLPLAEVNEGYHQLTHGAIGRTVLIP
ncbi:zinc-binding dehydrogenase [Amnibacterium flavum]|uniref:Zn-dependent alcohol dehydrogenase n=1 Tax=Amnibacterium flavum TaxID=2173173 RepID=A0A2V1HYB7_9MICO|nr:zinc-binding dehydrogenase [Amnibacterium flavum]PVZ95767.1 Zn-dependent alcohol dehydrogenase [Amnibacterium flavum]